MDLRIAILLVAGSLIAPALNGQELKPFTVDDLVAKNVEAKGGAEASARCAVATSPRQDAGEPGPVEFAYTSRPRNARAKFAPKRLSKA